MNTIYVIVKLKKEFSKKYFHLEFKIGKFQLEIILSYD